MFTKTEKKLLYYALEGIQYKLYLDNYFGTTSIECASTPARFQGGDKFPEIKTDKQLKDLINNTLSKLERK